MTPKDTPNKAQSIDFSPWYPQTLPEGLSNDRAMSTQPAEDLSKQRYDLVIVGGGIAGCNAAITAAKMVAREADRRWPYNILIVERDKIYSGLSSITGGLFTGLEIDAGWLASGIGRKACDEFNRRIILSIAGTRRMAEAFERDYGELGLKVITAPSVNMLVEHKDQEKWVEEEIAYLKALFDHDQAHKKQRLGNDQISVGSLRHEFTNITKLNPSELPPRYHSGYNFPGEFAVNPAAFSLMMRSALSEDYGPNVNIKIAEHVDVSSIDPSAGIIQAKVAGDDINFQAEQILLAGAPRALVKSPTFKEIKSQNPSESFRTLIAVTKPLPPRLQELFKGRAFHDTSEDYRYGWLHEETGSLVVGHSDYDIFPDIRPESMIEDSQDAIRALLGEDAHIQNIWAGDIPNSKDGIAHIHREERVLWIGHAGGRSLAAHTALGKSAAAAILEPEGRESLFLHTLGQRKDGYSAAAIAAARPDYLKPASFLD